MAGRTRGQQQGFGHLHSAVRCPAYVGYGRVPAAMGSGAGGMAQCGVLGLATVLWSPEWSGTGKSTQERYCSAPATRATEVRAHQQGGVPGLWAKLCPQVHS